MGGFKDDFDDFDDELETKSKKDDSSDDDFEFDDEEVDEDGNPTGKKVKPDNGGFNRDNYYVYKDKLVQLSGTIRPKERNKEGKVLSLDFKTDDKIYTVIMDDMGKKLMASCFQEMLVTGLVSKLSDKEFTIAIKTYI